MPNIKNKRRFGRVSSQRKALLSLLASALIEKERIKTTEAKAKELRPFIEKMVTRSMKGTIHSRRLLEKRLHTKAAAKLVKEIGPRYKERSGGYTRILKLGQRKTDGARMAIIEFV